MSRRVLTALVAALVVLVAPGIARADDFFTYSGSKPLADIAPGTVLKTRTVPYHLFGTPTKAQVTQILYRSTTANGSPSANATSVVRRKDGGNPARVVSYQSAYDSLNPLDSPSRIIAGGKRFPGGVLPNAETAIMAPLVARGYTMVIPDTEGPTANFAAGPEYGMTTLDSLRAVFATPSLKVPAEAEVVLYGYSGGAIGTEWAAEMAPRYAPDVNERLIGAAFGGVLVNPARNLDYVEGTPLWAGVAAMALLGATRAYGIDPEPFLKPRGKRVLERLQDDSIVEVLGFYPGLKWTDLVVDEYPTARDLPIFVEIANQLIMGRSGAPTIPLFVAQGARGELEGTPGDKPGIGAGDGVMVAGDVRTLVRQYCATGIPIQYDEYPNLSHTVATVAWYASAYRWIGQRFAGREAPSNCGEVPPGNPLDPLPAP